MIKVKAGQTNCPRSLLVALVNRTKHPLFPISTPVPVLSLFLFLPIHLVNDYDPTQWAQGVFVVYTLYTLGVELYNGNDHIEKDGIYVNKWK